ncbi:MAG: U32 family peptidase [Firmicutes bacterium]|nr:U32 family peptidase [Bacillota bacterium]
MTDLKNHSEVNNLPELLSPVGGRAQLEAAVNHGADAVYMGGSLFNARINAENFTEESLAEAIGFAHERGVKVYITFNTLIKDSELEKAFRYACRLYEMGADALILQDMGLARLVRNYLPDFPIHLSTQGTVYNVQALELVKQMGFSRVVPARELTLEEITRLTEGAHELEMDVEVFIHGALCMCYSGQCQMSRAFGGGGRSGNRGLCAQPCRLLYTDDKGRKGYYLSPKDLCTLDLMPHLIAAGVDSFKIEGRLKSAEYVAVTTAVYRKYLDLYAEAVKAGNADVASGSKTIADEWKAMIDPEDMQKLKRSFNRGGFTHGYLEGNPGRKILSGASPKNQGIYIGTVAAMKPVKGKGNTGREKILVTVQLQGDKETIAQGDGVEIRRRIERSSAEVAADSNVVTYVEELGNSTLRIGDFDSGILAGDRVYKVTDRALREEALAADEKKLPVRMRFCGYIEQKPTLELALKKSEARAEAADGEIINVVGDFAVEKALKKALTEEKIKEQLKKLGDTGFCADAKDICIEIDPDIMIPVSVINQMRRQAAEALSGKLRGAITRKRCTLTEDEIRRVVSAEQLGSEDEVNRVEGMAAVDDQPYILNVSKGELDDYIEGNFASIVDKYRDTGVLIGNLGWIKQFTDAGVQVYGDYGLNAYNGQSIKAYEELGMKMLHTSYERCRDGRTSDKRFKGKIPLMITEHPFDTDYLIDRKGVKHEIIKYGDKNIVL